jgi:hypothetical protein
MISAKKFYPSHKKKIENCNHHSVKNLDDKSLCSKFGLSWVWNGSCGFMMETGWGKR